MNRREFLAASGGGGALVLAGVGAALSDTDLNDGPSYGSVTTPPSSNSKTLKNGVKATLYGNGTIAFFGASLVTDSEGGTAVAGRIQNISESTIRQVRIKVQFQTSLEEILAQGWLTVDNLESEETWQFVASYPGDDPDRIEAATIATIERS
ncbi:FxLYD domain-containing protein [Halococcus sediminicola]|uniref:FxLYD domain-containing protein n=1 Tax=Halococcus sediminicola TaxID=1264579 RepID=UPI0012AB2E84|nr:FxLYD domain-containing protein [Halococcus sediminicola]